MRFRRNTRTGNTSCTPCSLGSHSVEPRPCTVASAPAATWIPHLIEPGPARRTACGVIVAPPRGLEDLCVTPVAGDSEARVFLARGASTLDSRLRGNDGCSAGMTVEVSVRGNDGGGKSGAGRLVDTLGGLCYGGRVVNRERKAARRRCSNGDGRQAERRYSLLRSLRVSR